MYINVGIDKSLDCFWVSMHFVCIRLNSVILNILTYCSMLTFAACCSILWIWLILNPDESIVSITFNVFFFHSKNVNRLENVFVTFFWFTSSLSLSLSLLLTWNQMNEMINETTKTTKNIEKDCNLYLQVWSLTMPQVNLSLL